MANEPERLSLKLASIKGGALAWIAREADRGNPVTRERFLGVFTGPTWDAEYGADLLAELRGGDLIDEQPDGRLSITRHALEWIDKDDYWRQLFEKLH